MIKLLIRFIKLFVSYSATAAIIFVLIFLISNFTAYYSISKAWILQTFDIEDVFVESEEIPNSESLLPLEVIRQADKLKSDIPNLSFSLTPPDDRIIIPRLSKDVPLIKTNIKNFADRKWDILDKEILNDLKKGIVIYPSSVVPGKGGNTVVTGHSSNYPWVISKYNDVLARLHEVILGDKITLYYNQKKYSYEVYDIKVVNPEDIEVMAPDAGENILTVITCTPVGTNLRRLVVVGKLV